LEKQTFMPETANKQSAPALDLQTIQAQIQNNGTFSPLHWLLQSGYLPFAGYEAWRHGEIASLDGMLAITEENLQALIISANEQTKHLELVAEPQLFHNWDSSQGKHHLTLSNNAELAAWLGQRWLRPDNLPQLDLFMDSGAAVAENELTDLLCQRRWSDAEQAYHQLSERAPGNSYLAQYEMLILYGKHMNTTEQISEAEAREELAALREVIAPIANDLLQHQAGDYLSAAWQRLAKNLPAATFCPEQPEYHRSFALAQLPDWPAVIAAIKDVPDFAHYPALLMRLAEAYWHQQPEIALLLWCKTAELDGDAEALLDTVNYARFSEPWHSFWELNLTVGFFPAYLLILEPGLLHQLAELPTSEPQHASFAIVRQLLLSRGNEAQQLAARQNLQKISPELLKFFLGRNGIT
jgi:hypothetical protein